MARKDRFFIEAVFLLMFSVLGAQGQVVVAHTEDILDKLRLNKVSGSAERNADYASIEGDVFVNEKFVDGLVKIIDDKEYKGKFRYDMYTEQVEFLTGDAVYTLTAPELVEYVIIGDDRYVYKPYDTPLQGTKKTYFIQVLEGDADLLIRKQVMYIEGEPAKLYQDAKPAKFAPISDPFYILIGDGPAQRVTNKKSLSGIFDKSQQEISSYIKKEKISPNKTNDLVKLVKFYNNL